MRKQTAKVYEAPYTEPKNTWKVRAKKQWKEYSLAYLFLIQWMVSLISYRVCIHWYAVRPTSEWAEFWTGFFENIQSEAFQVFMLIVLTMWFIAKGSAQSHKTPEEKAAERKEMAREVARELQGDPTYQQINKQLEQMLQSLEKIQGQNIWNDHQEQMNQWKPQERTRITMSEIWFDPTLSKEDVETIVEQGIDKAFRDLYDSIEHEYGELRDD